MKIIIIKPLINNKTTNQIISLLKCLIIDLISLFKYNADFIACFIKLKYYIMQY